MNSVIDLQWQAPRTGEPITAFVITPEEQQSFTAPWPAEALEWQLEWRRQFLAHHDPAGSPVIADAVQDFSANLTRAMAAWLAEPSWHPLRSALREHPDRPLRLRFEGAAATHLMELPWELLEPERPIWRLEPGGRRPVLLVGRARKPRVLLVVGDETGLSLSSELNRLEDLHQQGRLELRTLRGESSGLVSLRSALVDPDGWDVLLFLGHSEADPPGGGRLHLGDGSWVAAAAFQNELQRAATSGLTLALFNSCSGLDLARSCVAAGISWALCFRQPVPCQAASLAFTSLLTALEAGEPLAAAIRQARRALQQERAAIGVDLLLTVLANPQAAPLRLPLRKRKQFVLRLSRSNRQQALAAAALVALGAVADINPANPISTYLLDRRLYAQRLWRQATKQAAPLGKATPLPVMVLDQRSAAAFGATATPGRVSRDLIAKILQRTPPAQVPKLGLDVVLDEPAAFTDELAGVIRSQQRPLLFAGFLGEQVDARNSGGNSMPLPELQQAGLQSRNLATGTPAVAGALKWVPLQLWEAIDAANFAGTLSSAPQPLMPADAVIDWSIDWRPLLRRIEPEQLPSLKAKALVVGTDGSLDRDVDDLFAAPGAMDPALTALWQGAQRKLPGVVVQAVLAQSLTLGQWLTPISQALTAAMAAGLGLLLAAAQANRGRRVALVALIAVATLPVAWQLAIIKLWLLPLVLPLAALAATALLRRD